MNRPDLRNIEDELDGFSCCGCKGDEAWKHGECFCSCHDYAQMQRQLPPPSVKATPKVSPNMANSMRPLRTGQVMRHERIRESTLQSQYESIHSSKRPMSGGSLVEKASTLRSVQG